MMSLEGITHKVYNWAHQSANISCGQSIKRPRSRWYLPATQPAYLPEPDMAKWGYTHPLNAGVFFAQSICSSSWPSGKCA